MRCFLLGDPSEIEGGFLSSTFSVKVRWRMIAEIHANNDSEEGGAYGHDVFLSLSHLKESVRRVSGVLISHDDDVSRACTSRIS